MNGSASQEVRKRTGLRTNGTANGMDISFNSVSLVTIEILKVERLILIAHSPKTAPV